MMSVDSEMNSVPLTVIFSEDYKALNDWIEHVYDDFSTSETGISILSTLKDFSIMLSGCSDLTKYHFNSGLNGMWNYYTSYADSRDPKIFEFIMEQLKSLYVFVNAIEVSSPVLPPPSGSKRPFDNDDGFILPNKTARVFVPKIDNPVTTSNKFENLKNVSEVTDRNTETTVPKLKEPRPEPFFVKTKNWREISADIDQLAECKVFKKVQDNLIKFFPSTIEIYRKIQNYLIVNKIEFFGMKLKNERPRKVLIKGIPIDFPIDEIKGELSAQGFNVHRVSQLKNFRTKQPMPIYLVDVFVNDRFKHIFEMKSLMGFFVKVQVYKFKGAKQCYNCQLFNHSSECCFLDPVCLKCSGPHNIKECKVTDRNGIKCANCHQNHTANFGGCPMNPKNLRSGRVTTIRNSNMPFIAKPMEKNVTFSSALKGSNSNSVISQTDGHPAGGPSAAVANNPTVLKVNIPKIANVNNSHFVSNNVNNTKSNPIDNSNLLNFVVNNSDNFDIILDRLNKLCNVLENLQKVLSNKCVADILSIFSPDSLIGMNSSAQH